MKIKFKKSKSLKVLDRQYKSFQFHFTFEFGSFEFVLTKYFGSVFNQIYTLNADSLRKT